MIILTSNNNLKTWQQYFTNLQLAEDEKSDDIKYYRTCRGTDMSHLTGGE